MAKKAELLERLKTAQNRKEVIQAVALLVWSDDHDGAECPSECIPTSNDLIEAINSGSLPDLDGYPASDCSEFFGNVADWAVATFSGIANGEPILVVILPQDLPVKVLSKCLCFQIQSIEAVHTHWVRTKHLVRHPLANLVRGWHQLPPRVDPYRPRQRAVLPGFQRIGRDEAIKLPYFPGVVDQQVQSDLKYLSCQEVDTCPQWLLHLFDRAGGQSVKPGRGAPWDMRLFIGAFLHLDYSQRSGAWRRLLFRTEEVILWLHPDGWSHRSRDWDKFPAALDAIQRNLAYVSIPGVGRIQMISPSIIPVRPDDPWVEFTLRVPVSAGQGIRIDWERLTRYGVESAPLYRGYLTAMAILDHSAYYGHPITRLIGAPILGSNGQPVRHRGGGIKRSKTNFVENPSRRFVKPLQEPDLVHMLGLSKKSRTNRKRALKVFERLHDDGVIDLHEKGLSRILCN